MRLFVADDSATVHQMLRGSLGSLDGVTVVGEAYSGNEAIRHIPASKADVVLLDLSMPDGDGFSVLESFHANGDRPYFVVMSFHNEATFRERTAQLGATLFVDKGAEFGALVATLQHLAGKEFTRVELQETFKSQTHPCTLTK
jgi:two-component system response regulator (stage 0 sporulation protein A)